jgi:NAD(P)H-dependent FMN reductase
MDAKEVRIAVVTGSVRPGNYTGKAAALVADEIARRGVGVDRVDPAGLGLASPGAGGDPAAAHALKERIRAATGIVLATPEYHGSYSSVIKTVIENLGYPSVLAGKPVALLGVAAGVIGATKSLEHLRGVCAHLGAMTLPLAVSVANCQKAFAPDGRCLDPAVEKLVRGVARNLLDYIENHVCPKVTLERLLREGPAAAP